MRTSSSVVVMEVVRRRIEALWACKWEFHSVKGSKRRCAETNSSSFPQSARSASEQQQANVVQMWDTDTAQMQWTWVLNSLYIHTQSLDRFFFFFLCSFNIGDWMDRWLGWSRRLLMLQATSLIFLPS